LFGCSLGGVWEGRGGMGKKKKEMGAYNGFFWRNHSVGDAVSDIATSLYGYHSLNPSVLSVGKIAWRHHVVAYFQTKCIFRRWNRRYIPTKIFRRYIPAAVTDRDKLFMTGWIYRTGQLVFRNLAGDHRQRQGIHDRMDIQNGSISVQKPTIYLR